MTNNFPAAGDPAFYSLADAAWILGVDRNEVHRAIRVGTLRAVRRRSKLVIPAAELRRVLGGAR
ncbi:helix-turn-helix domain-containing protein [Amycolatopsis roodepoortensis]|uniref:helix-turn-helix domain-containing protein n=1 Tax=Amycolatopsis TaxID=1813 RepID=UPI000F7ABF77|nr:MULTISPECIES: helix-turn-helix domain-containing protein [Amycolatopsis]RSN42667.1 helix-turn-helix domain-containing protein [Amycolatopsis sp. WAC 04197]UUV34551.1 helix-turn-helix domain-containing protein [Amycolatopsis roodepoortensis]